MIKAKQTEKNEFKRCEPKRSMTLADGSTVELDALDYRDCALYQRKMRYKYVPRTLALSETYKTPDYMLPPKSEERFNERQKEYRRNVVTFESLRESSPKVVTSKNRQGATRYIFLSELKACRNGFIYYSLPFIIDVVFLLLNFFIYNFWANILFSLVILFDILCIYKTYKAPFGFFIKTLIFMLLIGANVGLYFLGSVIPGLYDLIYFPYSLKLLFIIFCFYHFGKFYAIFLRVYYDDCQLDKIKRCVQVYSGDPGSYKSFTMYHDASILAKIQWRKLCYEYYIWKSKEKEILKRNNKDELLEYNEIKRSFSFYYLSPCIPCLHTINGVKDRYGRFSHKISLDHLRGISPLPKYCVVVLDEVGAFLKQEYGMVNSDKKGEMLDVSDCFRLGRQYYNWILLCAEQDFNHIYIDVRRVVGFNKVMKGGQPLCRPVLLSVIYNILYSLKTDLLDKKIKEQPKYAAFLDKFNKVIKSIGFVRVVSSFANNTETDAKATVSELGEKAFSTGTSSTRFMPIQGVNIYDTYAYKKMNPSYYDKEIQCDIHTRLDLDGIDEENRKFLNSTPLIAEKREAIDELLKKIA